MTIKTNNPRTETMTPSWEAAVQICMAVLQNPEASTEAVEGAKQEILRVARIADAFRQAVTKI